MSDNIYTYKYNNIELFNGGSVEIKNLILDKNIKEIFIVELKFKGEIDKGIYPYFLKLINNDGKIIIIELHKKNNDYVYYLNYNEYDKIYYHIKIAKFNEESYNFLSNDREFENIIKPLKYENLESIPIYEAKEKSELDLDSIPLHEAKEKLDLDLDSIPIHKEKAKEKSYFRFSPFKPKVLPLGGKKKSKKNKRRKRKTKKLRFSK